KVKEVDQTAYDAWKARQDSTNPYHPFKNKLDWEVSKWAKQNGPTSTALDKLLSFPSVVEALGLSFKNTHELNQIIDNGLPKVPIWRTFKLQMDDGSKEYEVYFCQPLECLVALYSNPAFADKMVFAPEKQWADEEKCSRLYNEMNTGDWWWQKQKAINKAGTTIIPIILGSDESQLTVFSGNKEAYPVYITMGNIPKSIHQKLSKHFQMLLAYLPVAQFKDKNLTTLEQTQAKACIFHAALQRILQPLEKAGKEGIELMSGDGRI
ncbi:hypothetical protein FRC03_005855, partial [Tulasnella sp. 419]